MYQAVKWTYNAIRLKKQTRHEITVEPHLADKVNCQIEIFEFIFVV